MLVKKGQEVKLLIIKVDPWKRIERNEVHYLPESIFVIQGNVA